MPAGVGATVPVLVAAAGDPWETQALELIARRGSGLAVHRRCVDLHDLVATARTGLARVAVLSARLPGLDADTVDTLRRAGVDSVIVLPEQAAETDRARMERLGARRVVESGLDGLPGALADAASRPAAGAGSGGPGAGRHSRRPPARGLGSGRGAGSDHRGHGRVRESPTEDGRRSCWTPTPTAGRSPSTSASSTRCRGCWPPARSANAGRLDAPTLAAMARTVGDDGLRVLTGLPRPDRWPEVRATGFNDVLDAALSLAGDVVVDVGFCLEADAADPFGAAPQRNLMTTASLERSDRVLVVGAADPVGLARLARGLVDIHDRLPGAAVQVVVNRNRPTLGWSEAEVRGMVEGFVGPVPVGFLPDDRVTADRALMTGRSLVELGDSPLRRAVADLVDGLVGPAGEADGGRVRRRRAGRAR